MRMRFVRICLRGMAAAAVVFSLALAAPAVTIDWTPVGNPGNACNVEFEELPICIGGVAYSYSIGTYEVTNAQYAEFLNAKAASDPNFLYDPQMGSAPGGITRAGGSGSYTYDVIAGRGDLPVVFVSFGNAMRFANWLNNDQGTGDTETGAYTMTLNAEYFGTRDAGARIVVPTYDEWYKAAFYDPSTTSFFDYPTGSNTVTGCSTPTATPNRANCDNVVGDLTVVGSYTGSASPYGTFDQGANASEWNEDSFSGNGYRGCSVGNYRFGTLGASISGRCSPNDLAGYLGFRVAMIPEPGTGLLLMVGLIGLARRRRSA
jgi:formylglycine-generating enzyme required for sulfatase activity